MPGHGQLQECAADREKIDAQLISSQAAVDDTLLVKNGARIKQFSAGTLP